MDKKVRTSLGVQRQVVSISGTANRQAADVCLVKQRQVSKIHRKQPIVERFSRAQLRHGGRCSPRRAQALLAGQLGDVFVVAQR